LKQNGKMVVWPAALDSTKSRSQGRHLSKPQAIQTPRVDELENAAKKLSYDPQPSPHSALPSHWWEKSGYVLVTRGDKARSKVLKDIAAEIRKTRSSKQQPPD
jgi:signal recognition particle subunit SRP19